jgi:hypothetical protein
VNTPDPTPQPVDDLAANTRNALRNIIRAHGGTTEPTDVDIIAVLIAAKVDMNRGAKAGAAHV